MMNDRWMMQMYDTDCNAIIEEQELIAGLAEAGKFFYPHHTCSASATEFWTVFFDNLALVCTQLSLKFQFGYIRLVKVGCFCYISSH